MYLANISRGLGFRRQSSCKTYSTVVFIHLLPKQKWLCVVVCLLPVLCCHNIFVFTKSVIFILHYYKTIITSCVFNVCWIDINPKHELIKRNIGWGWFGIWLILFFINRAFFHKPFYSYIICTSEFPNNLELWLPWNDS